MRELDSELGTRALETGRLSAHAPGEGRSALRGLILLNAALLVVLGMVTFAPTVSAQGRVRGDYAIVCGVANGSNKASVAYIADVVNQELIAVMFSHDEKVLKGVASRNLRTDAADLIGGRVKASQESQKGGSSR